MFTGEYGLDGPIAREEREAGREGGGQKERGGREEGRQFWY